MTEDTSKVLKNTLLTNDDNQIDSSSKITQQDDPIYQTDNATVGNVINELDNLTYNDGQEEISSFMKIDDTL